MAVINTNIASLNAQNNLMKSQNELQTSLQRLSSGLRINSAKDDAAGLQISNRLTSQINGLNVATRNANDGISLAQTAEGAMQESTNILQRMRDLALQSANGSNSAEDRAALQKEVTSLQSELTRIAETTAFGGRKLIDGSFGSASFQVGSQANETISLSLSSVKASDIGLSGKSLSATALTGFAGISASGYTKGASDALSVQVGSDTKDVTLTDGMSAADLAGQYNSVDGLSGVSGYSGLKVDFAANTNPGDTASLNIEGVEINFNVGATNADSVTKLDNALTQTVKDALADKGITTKTVTTSGSEAVYFYDANGDNINVSASVTGGATDGAQVNLTAVDKNDSTIGSAVNVTAGADTTVTKSQVITGQLDFSNAVLDADYGAVTVTASGNLSGGAVTVGTTAKFSAVSAVDISSQGGAQSAVSVIDAAIASIDSQRSDLGAIQNRMESTISNLSNIAENVTAARSRIQDADFAQETANLTRNQILQQAGTSILAQANQLPQQVLSLLQ